MKAAALRRKTLVGLVACAALIVPLLAAAPALAELRGGQARADSYVGSLDPLLNHGNDNRLWIGHNGVGKNHRAYLKFPDNTVYDPDCQVVNADLYFASASSLPWGDNFWVAPAAADWGESTITWQDQPGPVTSAETNAVWGYSTSIVSTDVTEAVQYLDNNAIPKRGLVVRSKTTGDEIDDEQAWSSESPNSGGVWPGIRVDWQC
jgi:hypothetical protein